MYDIDKNPQKKSYSLDAQIAVRNNSTDNNIPQSNNKVKLPTATTNSNMQKSENNAIKVLPKQKKTEKLFIKKQYPNRILLLVVKI